MAVTLQDIAKRAKVSTSTVSSVVNKKHRVIRVGEPTRKRIIKLVEEMGYTPNISARALRINKSNLIGVIVSHMEEYTHGRIIAAIENELSQHGYHCLFSAIEDRPEAAQFYSGLLNSYRVDAAIMVGIDDNGIVSALTDSGFNTLSVCMQAKNKEIPYADVDNEHGTYVATNHLIELGHRKIAYIDGAMQLHNKLRRKGYQRAMAGSSLEKILLSELQENTSLQELYLALKKYFSSAADLPSAVVCFNDTQAFGVLKAAKAAGLKVPEDLSVVGFDDLPWSAFSDPSITTVAFPWEQIGQNAARMILEIARGNGSAPEGILVRPRLVERESTGPFNGNNK